MIISFLASHGGSSAKAIIEEVRLQRLNANIGIVITNNRNSNIFHWCLDNNIEIRHLSAKTHRGAEEADQVIQTVLKSAQTDLVVCSGYMKKIGPITLDYYSGRILNIHPSLLPKHGGKGMYGDLVHAAVLKKAEKTSGATVHFVTKNYDEGPVLMQKEVILTETETLESLRSKVQSIEPVLYIDAIRKLIGTT